MHRNPQKRIYLTEAVYFITTVTSNRRRHFGDSICADIVVEDLWFGKELKEFELFGYNVLHDHVHLLIQPVGKANYSEIVGTWKRNVSRDINDMMKGKPFIRNTPLKTYEGDDSNRLLQKNFELTRENHPHLTFEVYRKHLDSLEKLRFRYESASKEHGHPRFRWQKSFRDHIIRDQRDFDNHLQYIFNNAVKHGLVEDPEGWSWLWVWGMDHPQGEVLARCVVPKQLPLASRRAGRS